MTRSHLDDEQLSALLDGLDEATAAVDQPAGPDQAGGDHLRSCRACQDRLDELRRVAAAVGEPVTVPSAARRDETMEAALAAWDQERIGAPAGAATPADLPSPPGGPYPLPPRRAWALPRWTVVAAALIVVVLLAVPVLANLGGDSGRDSQTAFRDNGGGRADLAGVVDGGDLGDHSDAEALGGAVRQALDSPTAAQDSASPEAPPTMDSPEAPPTMERRAQESRSEAPPSAAGAGRSARRAPPCGSEVRSTYGQGLGELVYTASLRWQGAPAILLAYRLTNPTTPALARRAFVMSVDGCRLLVVQSL